MGSSRLNGGTLTLPFNYHNFLTNLHSCSCKRRFQVTTGTSNAEKTNGAVETVLAVPHHDRDLISNVHLKQGMCTLYCCESTYQSLSWEGGMPLQKIMQQQNSSQNYAFLFAGQTSIEDEVSDEAIHLAAATLAAGYRGVWKNMVCQHEGSAWSQVRWDFGAGTSDEMPCSLNPKGQERALEICMYNNCC